MNNVWRFGKNVYLCTRFVTIGNSVTSIGDKAFYNCISLTSVTMTTHSVELTQLLSGSVNGTQNNASLNYRGAGNGDARSREGGGDWDEE